MTPSQQKQIQRLMSNNDWLAIERFLEEFKLKNFVDESMKRNTEFETLWNAAEKEGAKNILQLFFNELENEAKKV